MALKNKNMSFACTDGGFATAMNFALRTPANEDFKAIATALQKPYQYVKSITLYKEEENFVTPANVTVMTRNKKVIIAMKLTDMTKVLMHGILGLDDSQLEEFTSAIKTGLVGKTLGTQKIEKVSVTVTEAL